MIVPGSKLGLIDIGSELHDYPDAEFIEELSLFIFHQVAKAIG